MEPDALFLFSNAVEHDPAVEAWFGDGDDVMRNLARLWFERMRACGRDVRELLHDGHPTACAGEAAFGYVNAFRSHINVGFLFGAALPDPAHLLEGTGKRMRHVKLRPGHDTNVDAVTALIAAAYTDIRSRL